MTFPIIKDHVPKILVPMEDIVMSLMALTITVRARKGAMEKIVRTVPLQSSNLTWETLF